MRSKISLHFTIGNGMIQPNQPVTRPTNSTAAKKKQGRNTIVPRKNTYISSIPKQTWQTPETIIYYMIAKGKVTSGCFIAIFESSLAQIPQSSHPSWHKGLTSARLLSRSRTMDDHWDHWTNLCDWKKWDHWIQWICKECETLRPMWLTVSLLSLYVNFIERGEWVASP